MLSLGRLSMLYGQYGILNSGREYQFDKGETCRKGKGNLFKLGCYLYGRYGGILNSRSNIHWEQGTWNRFLFP